MLINPKKILFTLISVFILSSAALPQQVITDKYPELKGYKLRNFWQLTLQGGFFIPLGFLDEEYFSSGNTGFDLSYRLNKEVAVYTELKYNILSLKDTLGPSSGYFESTFGVRLYLRPPCYRSSFFFEAGIGPYIFHQGSAVTPSRIYESETFFRFGANAGIGGEIVLSNSVFITVKSKLNSVFTSLGSNTYISGIGGITFRF